MVVDASPLRLNSYSLPAEFWGDGGADHAARVAAVRAWLVSGCGDYHVSLRRAIGRYLDAVAEHVGLHREALAAGLARFDGLYQPEDWFWSAPRPLPRSWWRADGEWLHAELAFWDGNGVIAMRANDFDAEDLPDVFRCFWAGEVLPVSPSRRPFSAGPELDPTARA